MTAWSGRRELNPRLSVGNAPGYHYTTPAQVDALEGLGPSPGGLQPPSASWRQRDWSRYEESNPARGLTRGACSRSYRHDWSVRMEWLPPLAANKAAVLVRRRTVIGCPGWLRTSSLPVNSRVLHQLSYWTIGQGAQNRTVSSAFQAREAAITPHPALVGSTGF